MRVILLLAVGIILNGCYMLPMAFIGPATSGFTTASIIQSGISSSANYIVKKSTGKSITEHAIQTIDSQTLKTSYFPEIKKVQKIDKLKQKNLKK